MRVEIFNGKAMALEEAWIATREPEPVPRGTLHVLAIGVNRFDDLDDDAQLEYAAQDARQLAQTLMDGVQGASAQRLFRDVRVHIVADGEGPAPTRQNILAALESLRNARAEDTTILFLASHGMSDTAGDYLFVPRDGSRREIEAAKTRRLSEPSSLIPWERFFEVLRRSAGRRLMIVDTCQAERIEGTLDLHSLAKRSAASDFALLAAAKGSERSQEYPLGGQGLFTYALLRALEGRGDRDGDQVVRLDEAHHYALEFVDKNRDPSGPQTPQLRSPEELREMALR